MSYVVHLPFWQITKDLKADTVLKNYWRNNERFADFFNAIHLGGRTVIKLEELGDRECQ